MRIAGWLVLVSAAVWGCTQTDENPDWSPRTDYPPWTYDAPFYYRPTDELKVAQTVGAGVEVYYTKDEHFFLRHPRGYQVVGEPRVAVWCSIDEGAHWDRCGYFGVEQSHFLFRSEYDGPHWFRFSGPGQGTSDVPPGTPHRIYVVDSQPPEIAMSVWPGPWDDRDKRVPHAYHVGEQVRLAWAVQDANLEPGSIKLGTCFAKFPHNLMWSQFPQPLPPQGTITIEIPPEAVQDGGMRFRMAADDKAGNTGLGFTEVLQVTGPGAGQPPAIPPAALAAAQDRLRPDPRPGWPQPGAFLRGGTGQVLRWLPEAAAKYQTLELEFSPNNGRSWQTVASGFKPPQAVQWTVPNVTSKNCRLRVVAVLPAEKPDEDVRRYMLASTQRFSVDSVAPDSIIPDPDKPSLVAPAQE